VIRDPDGKGETRCNRTACLVDITRDRWWNISTAAWYCRGCAQRINQAAFGFHEPILCFAEGHLPSVVGPGFRLPRYQP
jgi:hypothetical protein